MEKELNSLTYTDIHNNFQKRFRLDGDGDFRLLDYTETTAKVIPTVLYDTRSVQEEDKWLAKDAVSFDRLTIIEGQ